MDLPLYIVKDVTRLLLALSPAYNQCPLDAVDVYIQNATTNLSNT